MQRCKTTVVDTVMALDAPQHVEFGTYCWVLTLRLLRSIHTPHIED